MGQTCGCAETVTPDDEVYASGNKPSEYTAHHSKQHSMSNDFKGGATPNGPKEPEILVAKPEHVFANGSKYTG